MGWRDRERDQWQGPFWQQPSWLVAAFFLGALLATGVAAAVLRPGQTATDANGVPSPSPVQTALPTGTAGPTPSVPTGRTGTPAPSGSGAPGRGPGCQTDDSVQARPTAAPKGTEFKLTGVTLVPTSQTAGPLIYDGPVWHCYAHTPEGAARAAAVLNALDTPRSDWQPAAQAQITPASAAGLYVSKRLANPYSAPLSGVVIKMMGFAIQTYTPDQATVMMLASAGPNQYLVVTRTVKWVDGDWRLLADADGSLGQNAITVGGTNGFVIW